VDGGDVDELMGVDEVSGEGVDGEENALRGGAAMNVLAVDVMMVVGCILEQ